MYVIKEPSEISFDKVGIKGRIFSTNKLINSTQFVLVDTETGHETTIIEHDCDFCYYILEGKGYFLVNDNKEECSQGDLVVIPKGNRFTYKGKMRLLLVSTPPWNLEQEEDVD